MRRVFVFPVAAAAFFMATTPPTFAQPPALANVAAVAPASASSPLVHLASADAQTLADALRSVSKQAGGVAFVAEGKPYRARNSTPPLAPVVEKWPANGVPLDEAVQKIAGAYDYETERKGGVFLLRKRYTNPDDLPDVTAEELRLSLRDAVRAASGLPAPTVPLPTFEEKNTPFADKFYQTLTPAQIKSIAWVNEDNARLIVSELTQSQKQMMRDLVTSRHIQHAVSEPQKAYAALRACDQKTTAFGWADMVATHPNSKKTQTARSLCCIVREKGQTALVPFAPDGRMRFRFENRKIGYREAADKDNASAPKPSDYGPNHEPIPPPVETGPDTVTLQSLADILGKRERAAGEQIKPRGFLPQTELAAKHVTVVGINDGNGAFLWRAGGEIYGLHVVRAAQNGPLLIMRPRPQIARDLAGLNAAVFAAFPAPLVRLYRGILGAAEAEQLARPKSDFYLPHDGDSPDMKALRITEWANNARSEARDSVPLALRTAVFHRFRVLLEPRLTQSNNYRVLYSDLSAEEHNLWVLLLTLDCLQNTSGLENTTLPATITDFDKGSLFGFINNGFGATDAELDIIFTSRNDKGNNGENIGHVYPVPDSVPKKAKPIR